MKRKLLIIQKQFDRGKLKNIQNFTYISKIQTFQSKCVLFVFLNLNDIYSEMFKIVMTYTLLN